MAFDVDAHLATIEPPKVTIKGHTYVGGFISMDEWVKFEAEIMKGTKEPGSIDWADLYKRYLYAVFPRPKYAKWKTDPVPLILSSPALKAILEDLFRCQLAVMTGYDGLKTS